MHHDPLLQINKQLHSQHEWLADNPPPTAAIPSPTHLALILAQLHGQPGEAMPWRRRPAVVLRVLLAVAGPGVASRQLPGRLPRVAVLALVAPVVLPGVHAAVVGRGAPWGDGSPRGRGQCTLVSSCCG